MKSLLMCAVLLSACGPNVKILDQEFKTHKKWHLDSARHIRQMVSDCQCTPSGHFSDSECQKAADMALVLESRADWHYRMSAFELGISEVRPEENPPRIPEVQCPMQEGQK
jgi:hypothetical protein